jgi:RNA recognition motif-containing protein
MKKFPSSNNLEKVKMKKKSRGFAFVDFNSTENALRCLNALNNVSGAFGDGTGTRRPIVEFSFDDVRKLQIQKARLDKKVNIVGSGDKKVITKKNNIKRLGRGQKQRLKRRLAKEAKTTQ